MENVGTIFIDCGVVTLLWTTTFVQIESPTMIYLKREFIHVLCAVFFFHFRYYGGCFLQRQSGARNSLST